MWKFRPWHNHIHFFRILAWTAKKGRAFSKMGIRHNSQNAVLDSSSVSEFIPFKKKKSFDLQLWCVSHLINEEKAQLKKVQRQYQGMLWTSNFPDILHSINFTLHQRLPNAKAALPFHQETWNIIFCLCNSDLTYKNERFGVFSYRT